jgi:hypothetical protein
VISVLRRRELGSPARKKHGARSICAYALKPLIPRPPVVKGSGTRQPQNPVHIWEGHEHCRRGDQAYFQYSFALLLCSSGTGCLGSRTQTIPAPACVTETQLKGSSSNERDGGCPYSRLQICDAVRYVAKATHRDFGERNPDPPCQSVGRAKFTDANPCSRGWVMAVAAMRIRLAATHA